MVDCRHIWHTIVLNLRGFVAFIGCILFWSGMWSLLDEYVMNDSEAREAAYLLLGFGLLLATGEQCFVLFGHLCTRVYRDLFRYSRNRHDGPVGQRKTAGHVSLLERAIANVPAQHDFAVRASGLLGGCIQHC